MTAYIERTIQACLRNDAEGRQGDLAGPFLCYKYVLGFLAGIFFASCALIGTTILVTYLLKNNLVQVNDLSNIVPPLFFTAMLLAFFCGIAKFAQAVCSKCAACVQKSLKKSMLFWGMALVNTVQFDEEKFKSRIVPPPYTPPREASA